MNRNGAFLLFADANYFIFITLYTDRNYFSLSFDKYSPQGALLQVKVLDLSKICIFVICRYGCLQDEEFSVAASRHVWFKCLTVFPSFSTQHV
jgi:hypothetical protein